MGVNTQLALRSVCRADRILDRLALAVGVAALLLGAVAIPGLIFAAWRVAVQDRLAALLPGVRAVVTERSGRIYRAGVVRGRFRRRLHRSSVRAATDVFTGLLHAFFGRHDVADDPLEGVRHRLPELLPGVGRGRGGIDSPVRARSAGNP